MGSQSSQHTGLSAGELTRYSRHLLLPGVGQAGQEALQEARVAVVGAGGLGSPALLYLAAAGVGTIGIIDDDVVDVSNLQRQVVHPEARVGAAKVESAARSVADANRFVQVERHPVRLTAANALEILGGYDIVLDGTDNYSTRYLVSDACVLLGKPHVWGSLFQFEGQVCVWWAERGPCYRCAFPEPPPVGIVPSCAEAGVFGAVCGVIGSMQVVETLKLILGVGAPAIGRLQLFDALSSRWESVRIDKDPSCPACGDDPTIRSLSDAETRCTVGAGAAGSAVTDVDSIGAAELALLLREPPERFRLIDVRGAEERSLVSIPGSEPIELQEFLSGAALARLSPLDDVVLYCKGGTRSATALRAIPTGTVARVRHLDGGVLAWVDEVDPSLPRY